MILWLDAQISPALAIWIREKFAMDARGIREFGLRNARDRDVFLAARAAGAVVMTKDRDFVDLVTRHGPPPQILWLTFGNTSNQRMKQVLSVALPRVLPLVERGEPLVEIGDLAQT